MERKFPPASKVYYIGHGGNEYSFEVGKNCDAIEIVTTNPDENCEISWVQVYKDGERRWSAPEHKCERIKYGEPLANGEPQ